MVKATWFGCVGHVAMLTMLLRRCAAVLVVIGVIGGHAMLTTNRRVYDVRSVARKRVGISCSLLCIRIRSSAPFYFFF